MPAVEALESRGAELCRPERTADAGDFAWRVLVLLNLFRLTTAIVLFAVYYLVDEPRVVGETYPSLAVAGLAALFIVGCLELLLLQRRFPSPALQVYLLFAADVGAITLLIHASGGISSGLGGALIVSVGALALLVPVQRAFLLAAVAALVLLAEQSLAHLNGLTSTAQYAPTGLLGAVLFVITAVVQLLRSRIVETEALAEQRGLDLRNLVELNDYIIQHLRESIVVVDGANQIRLVNESALQVFGTQSVKPGQSLASIAPELDSTLQAWRQHATGSDRPSSFVASDGSTSIKPHFAPLSSGRHTGIVIFLEDTSLIAERVQQAKLAALGRLSASIAHEIRNPIGAMSHAGQLLAESPSIGTDDRRLTDIIRVNARRVSQIVESVLSLSRRDKTRPERLQLRPWLEDFAREFVQTLELDEAAVTVTPASTDIEAEMDPTHLHQILWNLCDNAVKYASVAAGAIAVDLSCGTLEASGRPHVDVADRGPGIDPAKVEEVFEPFYTGQPGGTGLGLYISRELAERNGTTLRYYARPGGGSVFRVVFADRTRWQNEAAP